MASETEVVQAVQKQWKGDGAGFALYRGMVGVIQTDIYYLHLNQAPTFTVKAPAIEGTKSTKGENWSSDVAPEDDGRCSACGNPSHEEGAACLNKRLVFTEQALTISFNPSLNDE